jgi:hypothetical protein
MCTKNRQTINNCLNCLLENGADSVANLCNRRNSYILTLYLEFEKQERLDVLNYFLERTKTWPISEFHDQTNLIDMELDIYIQKENNNKLILFIKHTNDLIKYEEVNHIVDYLQEKNAHYAKIHEIYENLNTRATLDLNLYHNLEPRCPICFDDTTGDNNHIEIKHPSCWCSPSHKFFDKEEMIKHTAEHTCKVRCPISGCKVLLITFQAIILHCEEHHELGILDKLPCPDHEQLDFRECTTLTGYPLMTNRHVAIYHIHTKAVYQLFLNSFKSLKLNFGESIYNQNNSNIKQRLAIEMPGTLTQKTSQKEQKPKIDTTQQSQTRSSAVNNAASIAAGNISYGATGGIGNSGGDGNDDHQHGLVG